MHQRNVYVETVNLALLMSCLGLVLFGKPIQAQAQEPHATRQELLKQQRIAKAQKLQDEQRGGLEKAALYIQKQKVLERLAQGWNGFHPVFGGLATGSGIAGGLRFAPNLLDGDVEFEVLGAISTRTYQLYELRLGAPRLGNGRFFADFYGNYRSGNRLPFFGLGPDSSNQNRTSFSAEPSIYDVTAGVNWTRWLSTGVRAGYLRTNTVQEKIRAFQARRMSSPLSRRPPWKSNLISTTWMPFSQWTTSIPSAIPWPAGPISSLIPILMIKKSACIPSGALKPTLSSTFLF